MQKYRTLFHHDKKRGKLFEQFILLETYRKLAYSWSEANIYFWRTNHGAGVDLLIVKHGKVTGAFEIKSSSRIAGAHLSGIRAFREEYAKAPCFIICTVNNPYDLEETRIISWKYYLDHLEEWI